MNSARPLIVKRIRDNIPDFHTVIGTANVQAVLRSGWKSPSCFVYRTASAPIGNSSCAIQQLDNTYSVLIALNIERDDGTVDDQCEMLSFEIMKHLLAGWRPFDKTEFVYAGGDSFSNLERNLLFWRDDYTLKQNVVFL